MAGQVKQLIDTIIRERSKGNTTVATTTKTKLILKGINPDAYSSISEDDLKVLARVREIAAELGVVLK
ncbi:MAG TPA: hypothetical protein VMB78_08380 [Dissulfurispiraceae bacterium]|nr:hypothetical protein [Dissulfurispiraceae bacterium]